ncbi:MAG: hypothetical protein E6K55_01725 [Gemmatimonadetes bacterium]|nr:MAG: hypothetical protein DMD67_16600 [Gemmatimonadota bacterium]PYO96408.1 MAG: hypothetical protein DMD61_14100 [Gemmatimonadota bacterium]TLY56104.1 MAG: hypothetical protein E6K55_01725 [Gemmatimonadota bacterium]
MDPQHVESGEQPQPAPPGSQKKRPWVKPELTELPRLTDLTLQTGSPIPGIGDPGGGSTVF